MLTFRSISSSDFDVAEGTDEIEIQADPNLISNKSIVTPTAGMQVLIEDSGTLKKGDVSNFLGAGISLTDLSITAEGAAAGDRREARGDDGLADPAVEPRE